jgi:transcriptional regulator with PAS, ATPase and Fis domain
VQGESGTGKELIARAIHVQGTRKTGPFVAVNCGAIPQNLFESELFGHKKGSFTGATTDKPGLFETAHGGTLFLDEVADLPADMQVKLLRVLQSGEVRRIGDAASRIVNVRVVAALNRDLKELVSEGRFREDLYYRLNVVTIVLPPLRERRDDVPLLVHHFLKRQHEEGFSAVTGISREALRLLVEHAWPGNVRQLETALKNAALFASGPVLKPDDFSELASFQGPAPDLVRLTRQGLDRGMTLKDFEDLLIRHTLELTGGNKKRTAELLGIDRRTLYNRLATMNS